MGYSFVIVLYSIAIAYSLWELLYHEISSALRGVSHGSAIPAGIIGLVAVVHIALLVLPALLALIRWRTARANGEPLLPKAFLGAKRLGYMLGQLFIWAGHAVILYSVALISWLIYRPAPGLPAGLGLGFGLSLYAWGIVCIELSIRRWKRRSH